MITNKPIENEEISYNGDEQLDELENVVLFVNNFVMECTSNHKFKIRNGDQIKWKDSNELLSKDIIIRD